MRLPLPAGWLKRLAVVLHRLAAALERFARSRPDGDAMAALSEQFPDAPEHWLQYIAARASHLASRRAEMSPTPRRDDGPGGSDSAWLARKRAAAVPSWLPEEPQQMAPPLALAKRSREGGATAPPAAAKGSARAHLRLLSHRSGVHSDATGPGRKPGVATWPRQRAQLKLIAGGPEKASARLSLALQEPGRSANLQLAASGAPAAAPDESTPTAGTPRPVAMLARASKNWLIARTRKFGRNDGTLPIAVPQSSVRPAPNPSEECAIAQIRTGHDAALRPVAPRRTPAPVSVAVRSHPVAPLPASSGIDHRQDRHALWPALPPASETAPSAPVPPPRLGQLRREQEGGLWSA